jgi:hypothetical protein
MLKAVGRLWWVVCGRLAQSSKLKATTNHKPPTTHRAALAAPINALSLFSFLFSVF